MYISVAWARTDGWLEGKRPSGRSFGRRFTFREASSVRAKGAPDASRMVCGGEESRGQQVVDVSVGRDGAWGR